VRPSSGWGLARLDAPVAAGFRTTPALLYDLDHFDAEEASGCPGPHPDGNHYLRMGCNLSADRFLAGPPEMG
jgi:hypothetical protein